MLISLIIPARNEKQYLENCVDSVIFSSIHSLEILIVDGCSDDGTKEIAQKLSNKYENVKLLSNEHKTVPFGMNLGIKNSSGDIIIRIDAHCIYPENYIDTLVAHMDEYQADCVGGVIITTPPDNSYISLAIAKAMSSLFGVGGSKYRTITSGDPCFVDTVPFGCYRRSVFDKIGIFDTYFTRNQDDEFNARLVQSGGKILLLPTLKIIYYSRNNIVKLSQMFFQYGLFKPQIFKKLGKAATFRQFVPLIFVLYLNFLFLFVVYYGFSGIKFLLFLPLSLYFLLDIFYSLKLSYDIKEFFYLVLVFPIIHISYGCGFLAGIFPVKYFNIKDSR